MSHSTSPGIDKYHEQMIFLSHQLDRLYQLNLANIVRRIVYLLIDLLIFDYLSQTQNLTSLGWCLCSL